MTQMPETYKQQSIKAIEYHYPHAKIYLFGSWATGKNKEYSDIDLAIDVGEKIDITEMGRMQTTIEKLPIANKVDLVDLNRIDADFKNRISQEMIPWKE